MKLAITYDDGRTEELSVAPVDMYWWEQHFDLPFGDLNEGSMSQLFYLTFVASQRSRGIADRSEDAFVAWMTSIGGFPTVDRDAGDDSPLSATTSPSTTSPQP